MRDLPTLDMQDRDTTWRELGGLAVSEIADSLRKRHGLAKQKEPANKVPKLRAKKCKQCKQHFQPTKPLQSVCGIACAIGKAKADKAKKERVEHRVAKEKLKPKNEYRAEAQAVFNKFIRLRDKDMPCVSCGRLENEIENTYGGKWDCGHFLSRGSHPELAFDERNAAKQCKKCNGGAGNFTRKNHTVSQQYEIELIRRIGQLEVDRLKGPHEAKHYTIQDYKDLKATYKKKLKELQA